MRLADETGVQKNNTKLLEKRRIVSRRKKTKSGVIG